MAGGFFAKRVIQVTLINPLITHRMIRRRLSISRSRTGWWCVILRSHYGA